MTGRERGVLALLVTMLTAVGGSGCFDESEERAFASPAHADSAAMSVDSSEQARRRALEPGALGTVNAAPVSGWTGPGGEPFEVAIRTRDPLSAQARRFGTITLRVSLRARAPDLGQYPCTSCHLGRRMTLVDTRIADAHENVRPIHPGQTGATCATCHAPDNVELLALRSGERATLDHTYRLCAQCHFAQAESWAGGAHGKRLDGWQGRRVVMGCADCHDPHAPALEPRIPFRAPRIQRTGGREP
ncbi:MAG TPA: hypothetical protein VLE53_05565 [Gemmatimonadaceae bacterium]|nr:hypothetical protein [Gemmatimonadaceae bacterium]